MSGESFAPVFGFLRRERQMQGGDADHLKINAAVRTYDDLAVLNIGANVEGAFTFRTGSHGCRLLPNRKKRPLIMMRGLQLTWPTSIQ